MSGTNNNCNFFSYILIPRFGPLYEQSTSVRTNTQTGNENHARVGKANNSYRDSLFQLSNQNQTFDFVRLATFFLSSILLDCVCQSNSIVRLNSIKSDCVRLSKVRLGTPGITLDYQTVRFYVYSNARVSDDELTTYHGTVDFFPVSL